MDAIRVQKHQTVKIVTSGYADRYLSKESVFTMTVESKTGETARCKFNSGNDARQFCLVTGMEWDSAYAFVRDAKVTMAMAARLSPRRWASQSVTPDELYSVQAYLKLRNSDGWKQEHIDRQLERLNNHPLSESLLAIVRGQLDECDRKNTEVWGHPNGRAAK